MNDYPDTESVSSNTDVQGDSPYQEPEVDSGQVPTTAETDHASASNSVANSPANLQLYCDSCSDDSDIQIFVRALQRCTYPGDLESGREESWNQTQSSASKYLKLRLILNCLPDVVYTGIPIGREGASIEVVLIDGLTGDVVKSGSEASAEVELYVLDREFNKTDMDDWTYEEFEAYILPGKRGKTSLLRTTRISLIEGRGSFSHIFFSHAIARYSLPKIEVKLGARLIQGLASSGAVRIREAVSQPFIVKDRRAMSRDFRRCLRDEEWRSRHISENGLNHLSLFTLETCRVQYCFLIKYLEEPQGLTNLLGLSKKTLDYIGHHAQTCTVFLKVFYDINSQVNKRRDFIIVGHILGLIKDWDYHVLLSQENQVDVCKLLALAIFKYEGIQELLATFLPVLTCIIDVVSANHEAGKSDEMLYLPKHEAKRSWNVLLNVIIGCLKLRKSASSRAPRHKRQRI